MNKAQKVEFLLTGETSIHLSKLSNPNSLNQLTEFLVAQEFIVPCEREVWQASDVKMMDAQDKAWNLHKVRFEVVKDFSIHVRTGGYSGSQRASIIESVAHDWVPNNRYWQEVGREITKYWAVPVYCNFVGDY